MLEFRSREYRNLLSHTSSEKLVETLISWYSDLARIGSNRLWTRSLAFAREPFHVQTMDVHTESYDVFRPAGDHESGFMTPGKQN